MITRIIYYVLAAALALIVTFKLPEDMIKSQGEIPVSFAEAFFTISSLMFLAFFAWLTIARIMKQTKIIKTEEEEAEERLSEYDII
jgi:hypothetical protein